MARFGMLFLSQTLPSVTYPRSASDAPAGPSVMDLLFLATSPTTRSNVFDAIITVAPVPVELA